MPIPAVNIPTRAAGDAPGPAADINAIAAHLDGSVSTAVAALETTTTSNTTALALKADITAVVALALTKRTITTAYTLVADDAINRIVHCTSATAVTVTLPADATSIAPEVSIPWRQYGAGQITFAAGAGATILSRGSVFKSAGQYAEGLATKVAANTWLLSGDIVA